jgi:hypothetical protein
MPKATFFLCLWDNFLRQRPEDSQYFFNGVPGCMPLSFVARKGGFSICHIRQFWLTGGARKMRSIEQNRFGSPQGENEHYKPPWPAGPAFFASVTFPVVVAMLLMLLMLVLLPLFTGQRAY